MTYFILVSMKITEQNLPKLLDEMSFSLEICGQIALCYYGLSYNAVYFFRVCDIEEKIHYLFKKYCTEFEYSIGDYAYTETGKYLE
jgi:hypothetical protein